ncbi:hypothetical protein, partial, partial [Parasitella parasitica]
MSIINQNLSGSVSSRGASPSPVMGLEEALSALQMELNGLAVKIATAGNKSASEVDPWVEELKVKTARMEELQKLVNLTSSVASSASVASGSSHMTNNFSVVVPAGLPYFQWEGMVSDSRQTVFADLDACLLRFEDVLQSHGLDFNSHWSRLLPRC